MWRAARAKGVLLREVKGLARAVARKNAIMQVSCSVGLRAEREAKKGSRPWLYTPRLRTVTFHAISKVESPHSIGPGIDTPDIPAQVASDLPGLPFFSCLTHVTASLADIPPFQTSPRLTKPLSIYYVLGLPDDVV